MHQHPRSLSPTASSASSLKTNPSRTNNMREGKPNSVSKSSNPEVCASGENLGDNESGAISVPSGPSKDALKKLDQIIQNFHTKAAILVLQSRVSLPVIITQEGTKKINKWFQIETDDTNSFRQELGVWRHCGGYSDRPPPLIIETYIDLSGLTNSQRFVIGDDSGKIWDAYKAINTYREGDTLNPRRNSEIILERWRFELRDLPSEEVYDFGSTLPTVYKKFIVFFRSLYATTKFVPTGRLVRNLPKNGSIGGSVKVNCRILNGRTPMNTFDALTHPIFENGNIPVTNDFVLGTTETPVGQVYAEVSYRQDCDFYIHNNEALLSSRFMGSNEYLNNPSLGYKDSDKRTHQKSTGIQSVPTDQQRLFNQNPSHTSERVSKYLSDTSSPGSSPIYAQRVLNNPLFETEPSPVENLAKPRPMHVSRNSINSIDGNTARRPSISFQPFKAGSLSSSPGYTKPNQRVETTIPHSSQSSPQASSLGASVQARKQSSLTAGTPATLRGGPVAPDQGSSLSVSSSPKPVPTSRYSSSFNRRRSQVISCASGRSVVDDDQTSSEKQSFSSTQPGSVMLHDIGIGGAAGSLQSDDDNISEFLKMLERQKTLKSFETSNEITIKRTSAQLSKYQSLRESHNALTESMSSSTLLNRSSISSSRQTSNTHTLGVPNSFSTSSSPGKPVSPHTPHTPAIPSRLSANSIADNTEQPILESHVNKTLSNLLSEKSPHNKKCTTTNAIDIPQSPQTYNSHSRRPNSVTQIRPGIVDADSEEAHFVIHRSISLGADNDADPPSLSALLRLGQGSQNLETSSLSSPSLNQVANLSESQEAGTRPKYTPLRSDGNKNLSKQYNAVNHYRHKSDQISLSYRINSPQLDSNLSLTDQQNKDDLRRQTSSSVSTTHSTGTYEGDDESLLFQMSEIGR